MGEKRAPQDKLPIMKILCSLFLDRLLYLVTSNKMLFVRRNYEQDRAHRTCRPQALRYKADHTVGQTCLNHSAAGKCGWFYYEIVNMFPMGLHREFSTLNSTRAPRLLGPHPVFRLCPGFSTLDSTREFCMLLQQS